MTKKILQFISAMFMLAYTTGGTVAMAGVFVQSMSCPVGGRVQVLYNQTYYVRPNAGGRDVKDNDLLGTVTTKDGWIGVDKVEGRFFHLTEIGWVLGEGLEVDCGETTVTPTLSPTSTPTTAPKFTPTVTLTPAPQVTPTRLTNQIVYCSSAPTVTPIETKVWRVECQFRQER